METRVTTGPYAVADGDGRATWFAGALLVHKAEGEATNHRFDLLDQTMPPGYVVPRHLHHAEDEAWYVLDGDMTFRRELGVRPTRNPAHLQGWAARRASPHVRVSIRLRRFRRGVWRTGTQSRCAAARSDRRGPAGGAGAKVSD